jgi:hypothetical protein
MKGYCHLTDATRQQIVTLSKEGRSQKEICEALSISRGSAYHVQRLVGLQAPPRRGVPRVPLLTPLEEMEVFALLFDGVGTERIATQLTLRVYLVRRFAEEHFGRRRAPACRWDSLPKDVQDKIDAEIRSHTNRAVDIAARFAEYGLTDNVVLKRAHDLLECAKFLTGRSQPLTSNLPQKTFRHGPLSA